MLRRPQSHVNRRDNGSVSCIFWQHIERNIVCIKYRLSVKILRCGRFYHNPLFPEPEFVYIAVIRNVHALHYINGVCIYRNPCREQIVVVVRNVQPVNNKLSLAASGMNQRRNLFKALYIFEPFLGKHFTAVVKDTVLDNIVSVIFFAVDLQINIVLTVSRNSGRKRALTDIAVLPRQRINVLNGYIIEDKPRSVSRNDFAALADLLSDNSWDICNSAKCGLHLLHFVCFNAEVVLRQNLVNELLFFLPLKCDFDLFVHQEVCPVLAQLLPHSERIALAVYYAFAVADCVIVKPFDIPLIPALPLCHLAIECFGDCGIAKLVQFDNNCITH